jgi:mevalonate kinase
VTTAFAPAKIILLGEHAVVYGRPAIALPVTQVRARAVVEKGEEGKGIVIVASDLRRTITMADKKSPLRAIVASTLQHLGVGLEHDLKVTVKSSIPIARGLGSGASVSTATARALAKHFGIELTPGEVSRLVYEVEKLYHGTPSGIDNTVIAFQRPVFFRRNGDLDTFQVGRTLLLLVADTGVESPTSAVVDAVRQARKRYKEKYEAVFDRVEELVLRARRAIELGDLEQVGRCMDQNHRLLQLMEVSSPQLDTLVAGANRAGALGAKLSGAGRGGNMIALVTPRTCEPVKSALVDAGAVGVIETAVQSSADSTPALASREPLA